MKLQFDPKQKYQLEAIRAVTDLFDGQPLDAPEFSQSTAWSDILVSGEARSELGVGNQLRVSDDALRINARSVQARNDIEVEYPAAPLAAWSFFDIPANEERTCPHFSIEMETGTGKTYVYLRTIFELHRLYGFKKFVIVVPSVAIREGVLKNIDITREHFQALFSNVPFEPFVYDGKKVNRLRQFAVGNTLQIQVINIDAFRKNFTGTDDEKKSNVIYKESDKLSGRQPIEFIQAARPIVIIDEPQSVDNTPQSQEAIKALNPLFVLRYSATHRDAYNLVYRLDPIRAFELRLVKQIVVASATADSGANDAFVRVESIDYKPTIRAKVRIHVQGPEGPKEKSVTLKVGDDLFVKSNEREAYRDGFIVAEINGEPGSESLRFNNGQALTLGTEIGGRREDLWRAQIKHTIKKHLDKEVDLKGRGIKVLSLFFIDRVAHYRDYDSSGHPIPGKFALEFEALLSEFLKQDRYKSLPWASLPIESVHNGYFAADTKGVLKDTNGSTKADDDVYNLIMKDKERLLSEDEPLRFIFSHSALREGWDSPNVFQICTLNETSSTVKKRQEIGRGLRLPVDQHGNRVFDEKVNKLFVMANESYEDFARALQTEYEQDCGVTFGKVPITALAKLCQLVDGREQPIGLIEAESVKKSLVAQKFIDAEGKILPPFDPNRPGFVLTLPKGMEDLVAQVTDVLASYRMDRHIRKDKEEKANPLKKEVLLTPEFEELWQRIKPRTTYRLEFSTAKLIQNVADEIRKMEKITPPRIRLTTGNIEVKRAGVQGYVVASASEDLQPRAQSLPDILAYLQNETELTRSTLVSILKSSGRLEEFFIDPQRYMDQVAKIIKHVLHSLVVDGIKYEKIPAGELDAEWELRRFESPELVDYLSSIQVNKSVYPWVQYDSEVERVFASKLDSREDIRLFVKLPRWFEIDTPVGKYNPDWAIVKHDEATVYLAKETKSTKDFLKLRGSEVDRVKCGMKHFQALNMPFEVVVNAEDF